MGGGGGGAGLTGYGQRPFTLFLDSSSARTSRVDFLMLQFPQENMDRETV